MQKEGGVEVAQDYYLQGIRCNPNHFPCVYNVACVYSRLDKQCNARKWFNHAIKINPNILDSYYGSALSSFKLKNFQEAFNTLKSIPANAETQSVKQEELIYFRSQCMKKVGSFHDAEREYKSLMNQF
jgi:tetratricopeptide (TPR) repeat protein